jgi:hypothetical protein
LQNSCKIAYSGIETFPKLAGELLGCCTVAAQTEADSPSSGAAVSSLLAETGSPSKWR